MKIDITNITSNTVATWSGAAGSAGGGDAHCSCRFGDDCTLKSDYLYVQFRSYLGEALRAVLVAEVRAARVISCHPPDRRPAHLPSGCDAVKASLRSVSGGRVSVILGGPPEGDTDSASAF